MDKSGTDDAAKRSRGRPTTRELKLDASPEEVARAIFSAVKRPDPRLRVRKRPGPSATEQKVVAADKLAE